MIKYLAEFAAGIVAIWLLFYLLFYGAGGGLIRRYKMMVLRRNRYDREISRVVELDESRKK